MIDRIKEFAKNKNNLVVLVLAGVLLMVITFPIEEKEDKSTDNSGDVAGITNSNTSYLNTAGYGNIDGGTALCGTDGRKAGRGFE